MGREMIAIPSWVISSVEPRSAQHFPTLPGEIQNEVYRMLLTTRHTYEVHSFHRASYAFSPAVLHFTQQIYTEAVHMLKW